MEKLGLLKLDFLKESGVRVEWPERLLKYTLIDDWAQFLVS